MVTTFLPFEDITSSLRVLDQKRLNKQKLENLWILKALEEGEQNRIWKHPAVQMWVGYRNYLIFYHNRCIEEWVRRGYNSSQGYLSREDTDDPLEEPDWEDTPWFVGWEPFHKTHQASLIRKDPEHYSQYFQVEQFYLERGYLWPSHMVPADKEKDIEDLPFAKINLRGIKPPTQKTPTIEQLKQMCRDQGIKGFSKLNKPQLLQLLNL